MLDRENDVLGFIFGIDFLVVNFNNMQTRQLAHLQLTVPLTFAELVVVINYNLLPVLLEVGIRVAALSEPVQLIQVLDHNKVAPALTVTESLQLLECELERASKHHIVFKCKQWII